MYPAIELAGRFAQVLHVADVVDFAKEARLPVVAALNDMLDNARQIKSFHPWHILASIPLVAMMPVEHFAGRRWKSPDQRRDSASRWVGKGTLTPVSPPVSPVSPKGRTPAQALREALQIDALPPIVPDLEETTETEAEKLVA